MAAVGGGARVAAGLGAWAEVGLGVRMLAGGGARTRWSQSHHDASQIRAASPPVRPSRRYEYRDGVSAVHRGSLATAATPALASCASTPAPTSTPGVPFLVTQLDSGTFPAIRSRSSAGTS